MTDKGEYGNLLLMNIVSADLIKGKRILLRLDLDVAISNGQITEDYKIRAGIPTINLCIVNASKVIIIGHLGRPFKTVEDEKNGNPEGLSAKPIQVWLEKELGQKIDFAENLDQANKSTSKIVLLENIRFFHGEVPGAEYHSTCISKTCDVDFAKSLASLGDVYINEAFSSYRSAASTTILPTLFPHVKDPEGHLWPRRAAGLRFGLEVEKLTQIRNNPKKPFIAIMGGAKVEDKVPVIRVLAQRADAVLVGGKLVAEIREQQLELPANVLVGKLTEDGFDIAEETISAWKGMISKATQIVWNGPVGKIGNAQWTMDNLGSEKGSYELAKAILETKAETIIGGGDIIAFLGRAGLIGQFENHGFVSVGGGAMLKFLSEGTLSTVEALN